MKRSFADRSALPELSYVSLTLNKWAGADTLLLPCV